MQILCFVSDDDDEINNKKNALFVIHTHTHNRKEL